MTTPQKPLQCTDQPLVRRRRSGAGRGPAAAAVVVSATVAGTLLAAPAHADVPEGWSDPAEIDVLQALLILGGVPLLLFLVITLAVYLPGLVRGERVAPGAAPVEDEWFGGPRQGTRELSAGSEPDKTGGAHGSW